MSHGHFIIGLTLIGIVAAVITYLGIRWSNRSDEPEPIEHGDGEP